jgi:hypothetical protein
MPCDTIQTNTIDMQHMNAGLLSLALKAIGATSIVVTAAGARATIDGIDVQIRGGKMLVCTGYEHLADRVKVAYGRQSVFHAAKINGWKVRETKPNVFQVVK